MTFCDQQHRRAWPGPGTPSRSCIQRPRDGGPTSTAPWPPGTGSTKTTAGTIAGRAATPVATQDRESKIEWKSTEHNIDVYAFFRLLARDTGESCVVGGPAWARRFVVVMWDPGQGRFYVGTSADGVTPETVPGGRGRQQLVYLALQDPAYGRRWAGSGAPGRIGGRVPRREYLHRRPDRRLVRGTAHVADALGLRRSARGPARARTTSRISPMPRPTGRTRTAWGSWPHPMTRSIRLRGRRLYASLHTGTTAWYILAARTHRSSLRGSHRQAGGQALSPIGRPQAGRPTALPAPLWRTLLTRAALADLRGVPARPGRRPDGVASGRRTTSTRSARRSSTCRATARRCWPGCT